MQRPNPTELTNSLGFVADGAWPALSEDTSVEAQVNGIPCRGRMASALRRHVCGGSNKSNSSRNQLISLRTGHGQTRLRSPTSIGFVRNKHVLWHEPWRGGKRRTASDKQNDCLLGKRRKRIWTSIYEFQFCMELFANHNTIKPRIVDVRENVKKKKVSETTL
jgi:hypothetical protein